MRSLKICGALLLVVMGPVQGGIVGTTGNIQIVSPPASILANVFESDSFVRLFPERTNLVLGSPAAVNVTAPGTYTNNALSPGTLTAGSVVSTYYLIFDPIGTPPGFSYSGSVTFDRPILGIAALDAALNATDFAGAPGTTYPTGLGGRAFDIGPTCTGGCDHLTLSADRRTITISGGAGPAQDELRVFESAIPEPGPLLACTVGLALITMRRTWKRTDRNGNDQPRFSGRRGRPGLCR